MPLQLHPIGYARTGHADRLSAPRQPYVAGEAPGTIELLPGHGYEDALCDLDAWSHVWVIFWFHLNKGWRPKVLPPRSTDGRKGVFSTRAPHRPNPLGMSVLKLDRVEGLTLHVRGVDLIDGTPVLDIKPYVPMVDVVEGASTGWIGRDPAPPWQIVWSDLARAQRDWLAARGVELGATVERTLSVGVQAHAYRRIRQEADGWTLAVHDWRVRFTPGDRRAQIDRIDTGYRGAQLADEAFEAAALHRAFVAQFGT